jgi:hypothetical protein
MIHSSVVGHLGCFQRLAIMNKVVMNIGGQVYYIQSYVPLGRCPGAVSLDHITVLSLAFWGISILFSKVVVLTCIPTSSV